MQEKQFEKLSLLVDDQLDDAPALSLLKSVQRDKELQAKLRRYALISQALKSEQTSVASLDFVENVKQQIKQEPIYFLPQQKPKDNFKKASLAVAASMALAVVWVSAGKLQNQVQPYTTVNNVAQQSLQEVEMNAHFKEYLQAHDNVWYVNNNVGVQSYARLASYQSK